MTKYLSLCLFCAIALSLITVQADAATRKKAKPAVNITKALAGELPKAVMGGKLSEVLVQFGQLIDVPVIANWPDLQATGVKRSTNVAVRVGKKISAEKLLSMILMRVAKKGSPLSWYESNGVLVVATQRTVLGRKTRVHVTAKKTKDRDRRITSTALRTHSFKNEPLKDVIEFYRNLTGVNFHVSWKSLQNVSIDNEEPITLIAKGISISRALDMITAQLSEGKDKYESVYWMIDRGVVTITSGHALNTTSVVTMHQVGDLLFSPPNFKGPRLGRSTKGAGDQSSSEMGLFDPASTSGGDSTEEGESAAETREKTKSALEKIIIDSIGEEMWIPGGGKGSVRFFRNNLIISQTRLGYMLMKKAGVLNAFNQIQ
jgi:hypothetical protein